MKWTVSVVVAHPEQGDHRETDTNDIDAASQASAAAARLAEGLPFNLTATDELLIFVTPGQTTDDDPFIWDTDRHGPELSREQCLERATERPDVPGWKQWWETEASRHKPRAEGGGLTDQYRAQREAEEAAWHARNKTPRA